LDQVSVIPMLQRPQMNGLLFQHPTSVQEMKRQTYRVAVGSE